MLRRSIFALRYAARGLALFAGAAPLYAGIHSLPVVIPASKIATMQYHPLAMYRLFQTAPDGTAIPIPFQIDERDRYGDFILDEGPRPNTGESNNIFDFLDELSFMGNDVGLAKVPTKWPFPKPAVMYELTLQRGKEKGAVYVGAYFQNPPEAAGRHYVNYAVKEEEIVTSRYRYRFDRRNYLIVRGVDINKPDQSAHPLIASSTLFLRADLKYFVTLNINQESIQSELDAYKCGPIRCTARVNFNYRLLKLNFDLGMYTEVSFFSNAVVLPAVIDNPLEGAKVLNKGSEFYYGFSLEDNPEILKIDTNMPTYAVSSTSTTFDAMKKNLLGPPKQYWFNAVAPDYIIYVEMEISDQMLKARNVPTFYKEHLPAKAMLNRKHAAQPLGKSPVNLAIAMDLTAFSEGIHNIAIKLFVENRSKPETIDEIKASDEWETAIRRVASSEFK